MIRHHVLAIRASCSLPVRAMRACAQGRLPPGREVWGGLRSPGKHGGLEGRRPANSFYTWPNSKSTILLKLILSRVVVVNRTHTISVISARDVYEPNARTPLSELRQLSFENSYANLNCVYHSEHKFTACTSLHTNIWISFPEI